MTSKQFSEALGEIDSRYLEEALGAGEGRSRLRWRRAAALAACAALILVAILVPPRLGYREEVVPPREETIALRLNKIDGVGGGQNLFDLAGEDFIPMSYEELLSYFQVTLPIEEVCPSLSLMEEDSGFGRFASDSRGTYFDGNTVVFSDKIGQKQVFIGLQKAWKCSNGVYGLAEESLQFTTINGRDLAVFRYQDEDGSDCCYMEFVQNDVAFFVRIRNLSREETARCLQALVEEQQDGGEIHTITGEVNAVDPYRNHVGIHWEEGSDHEGYGVDLPKEISPESYSLGDKVKVTYRGEPALINTILAQQLVEIETADS